MLRFILENISGIASVLQNDFVIGYMKLIDGEKDPRLLLEALSMYPDITQKYFPDSHKPFAGDYFKLNFKLNDLVKDEAV